ncbi:MAG: HAMP domain-containing protein [Oscillatoriales cyanobacterium SM2_3_0]|nr:HAMP domain-containing protein [Oscillatoriales cyanobacterium SM2_3_0]
MAPSVNFRQEYEQTERAYTDGDYEKAAALVYQLVEDYPEDPSARLLCGHIYGYGLQQYDVAKQQYLAVLDLTKDSELVELAHQSIEVTEQYLSDSDLVLSGEDPPTDEINASLEDSGLDDYSAGNLLGDGLDDDDAIVDTFLESPEFQSFNGEAQDLEYEEAELNSLLDELPEPDLADIGLEDDIGLEELDFTGAVMDSRAIAGAELSPENTLGSSGLDFQDADVDFELDHSSTGSLEVDDVLEIDWDDELNLSLEADSTAALDESPVVINPFANVETSNTNNYETNQGLEEDLLEEDLEEIDDVNTQLEFSSDETEAVPVINDAEFDADDLLEELNLSGNLLEEETTEPENHQFEWSSDQDSEWNEADLGADLGLEPSVGVDVPLPVASSVQHPVHSASASAVASMEEDLDDIFSTLDAPMEFDSDLTVESESAYSNNGKSNLAESDLDFDMDSFDLDLDDQPDNTQRPEEIDTMSIPLPAAEFQSYAEDEDEFDEVFTFDDEMSNGFDSDEYQPVNDLSGNHHSGNNALELPDDSDFSAGFDLPVNLKSNADGYESRVGVDSDFLDDFGEFEDFSEESFAENGFDHLASFEDDSVGENFTSGDDDTSGFDDEDLDLEVAFTTSPSAIGSDTSAITGDELFNSAAEREAVVSYGAHDDEPIETMLTVEQGPFAAFLENAPLKTKFFYTAIGTGLASLIFVAVTFWAYADTVAKRQDREVFYQVRNAGTMMTLVAGVTGFLTTWGLGSIVSRQVGKATNNLQSQFDAIAHNNLKARATVYATDEFGQMASKFNNMAQFVETTTYEAQRKADEQEEAKENLQRQVIRLLDDVEGAARGDLTVSAEVTADVLGAVADSFNLTIQNLREIVVQVKQAARQVSQGSTDSSTFAKDVAGDALRQAEELAATLNSVQVLTDAIQRVADSAREAEEVARSAAAVATKGGESVQMTVSGILKIRETVAETTREVKRLAESSQEISKIVAIISQIASRTNLLALNASIEAARAGEAGRGFAIVADEVRQLADRSAKSLKEIEQIVMQIQSQTSSVMMAMEEGNQQVIEGTRLAEQAKRSLDDIIQVTNRIDVLVRSITADTVEQNETARAVANVMQTVEHSAQETSQEAHRVSSALSNLVGVARDMLTSVERFRVDATERK